MDMEKRLFSILLVVILTAGVFLGSTQEIRQKAEEEQPEEVSWSSIKETIYIWYTDEALSGYIGTAAVNFSEAEGVRVIPVLKPSYQFLEGINEATLHAEQQIPDLYVINNDELEKAYLAGLAVPIGDEGRKVSEQVLPKTAISAVSYNGHRVAYPFYFDTSVLIYNQDYLEMWMEQETERKAQEEQEAENPPEQESDDIGEEEDGEEAEAEEEIPVESIICPDGIPLTVDGIRYFADTFDAPEKVDGVMRWDVSDIFYNYWFVGSYLSVGGDSGDDYANIRIYNEEVINCLKVYQALNQFFYIEPDKVNYDSAIQDFIDGKTVFTIGSTDALKKLENAALAQEEELQPDEGEESGAENPEPDESGDEMAGENGDGTEEEPASEEAHVLRYGFTTLPRVSTKLDSRALSVTNAVAINGFSDHKELADRFAQYLTQEFAGELYERAGKISVLTFLNRQDENLGVFGRQYEQSVSLPKMMEIGNLWLQLEALFSKVWNGEDATPLVQELEKQVSTQISPN